MLKFFREIFKSKQNNDYGNASLAILIRALPEEIDLNSISKIIFIAGVEYSKDVHRELKLAIERNELNQISNKYGFNVLKDAMEIYLFIRKDNSRFLCILFSPYEVYDNEYIMDLIDFYPKVNISDYKDAEVIFDSPASARPRWNDAMSNWGLR